MSVTKRRLGVWGVGCGVWGVKCGVRGVGFRVSDVGFEFPVFRVSGFRGRTFSPVMSPARAWVEGSWFGFEGVGSRFSSFDFWGLRISGDCSGCRVQSLGFRDQGSGFRECLVLSVYP